MKKLNLVIGFILINICVLHGADKPFSVTIIPESRSEGAACLSLASNANSRFFVVLANLSGKSQPIFERWNSWGYQTISFEFVFPSGKKAKIIAKQEIFTRNIPSTYSVPLHGYQVFLVTLNGDWEIPQEFEKASTTKVIMKAIYEVTPSQESKNLGVWAGRIESKQIEVPVKHL